jgi:hypothetical protein
MRKQGMTLLLCLLALGGLACEGSPEEGTEAPAEEGKKEGEAKGEGEAKAGDAKAGDAKKEGEAGEAGGAPMEGGAAAAGGVELPLGFDPKEACAGNLEASKIPPVPVIGTMVKNKEEAPSLVFKLASGRMELRENRASLRLASEQLKPCSPFLADGGLAKQPRLAATFASLEKGSYTFPDKEAQAFKYWNYVYTTDKGTPFTMNAFSAEDKGLVVIDEVNEAEQKVVGRLLFCKAGGAKGWATGNFEVEICDKRPRELPKVPAPEKEKE